MKIGISLKFGIRVMLLAMKMSFGGHNGPIAQLLAVMEFNLDIASV